MLIGHAPAGYLWTRLFLKWTKGDRPRDGAYKTAMAIGLAASILPDLAGREGIVEERKIVTTVGRLNCILGIIMIPWAFSDGLLLERHGLIEVILTGCDA